MSGIGRRGHRAIRFATAAAAAVLIALGAAYALTYEPAAQIGIAWRLGLTTEQRRAHERRFQLANRRLVQGKMVYDLRDTRKDNVAAIINEPDVVDTDGIDRTTIDLPIDYRYGEGWTWVAYRLPWLREPGVVRWLVLACTALLAAGFLHAKKRGPKGAASISEPTHD